MKTVLNKEEICKIIDIMNQINIEFHNTINMEDRIDQIDGMINFTKELLDTLKKIKQEY